MNPFQTSEAPANSSPTNLDRMASLLNSMITDLKLPNVPPQTTEIPERPTSAESGYISDKEDKEKPGSKEKAFVKPLTAAKESVSTELKAIPEPLGKVSDQEPVATQAVEPQTEKAPEKDAQNEILVIS